MVEIWKVIFAIGALNNTDFAVFATQPIMAILALSILAERTLSFELLLSAIRNTGQVVIIAF